MIIKRYVTAASIACTMAFGFTGSAFASTVSVDTTGPDSVNKVEINNSSSTTIKNDNDVNVVNLSAQSATTGSVKADDITTLNGGLGSGNASNNNATNTSVNISNGASVGTTGNGGNGNGNGNGNGGGTTVTPGSGSGNGSVSGSTSTGVTPGRGSVLGAATTTIGMGAGASVLPEVGAQFPVDVSALRAAWHPQTATPAANLTKSSSLLTNVMLATATLLSLLGAAASAWWTKRREERA